MSSSQVSCWHSLLRVVAAAKADHQVVAVAVEAVVHHKVDKEVVKAVNRAVLQAVKGGKEGHQVGKDRRAKVNPVAKVAAQMAKKARKRETKMMKMTKNRLLDHHLA